ncbi:hypothetical protein CBR_g13039 [Chara braunii]|uniref:Reverse transcriptase domain-containing protein n=1 Tax=Chara braunii TaxID=69332 RepID=A0A388KTC7_CHABU|nr:hypothetical protein CBR_g13039 [Chara braunii]|eukprot:GBG73320.1 hypothetical protein CBR_g13039 [Chara braunii]
MAALTLAKERQDAAEADKQRLAAEAAAHAQQQVEAAQLATDQPNADSVELLISQQDQWTAVLNGMRYVPVAGAEPTTVQQERQNLADILLNTMRAVIRNSSMGELHSRSTQQLQNDLTHNVKTLATAVKVVDSQLKQMDTHIAALEARPSQAAPGCTTNTAKQLNGRIDHVVNLIGDLGAFTGPDTISSTVAAIKMDITKLQTRPDAATKNYKMPHFNISKFDNYNKTYTLTWWQGFLTEASCRTVPAEDMLKALYLQLIGGAQAWMNHLAATKQCTIAELHTHITWKEFEQLWFTRFMVRNVVKAAMNEVYTSSQGSMPTRDWTIKWRKIVTTPGFDLSFPNQRSEFFSRSCARLRSALGNEYDYASFQAILDRANLVIQTDDKATNEKQSQPHYVAKQGYQRPTHNNAVISEESVDLHAAAASSSDGGAVAALPPSQESSKKLATQATTSTGTGQQPWTAYDTTKEVFDLRQRIRDAIARNDVEEMGLVFLHALPSLDGPAASPPDPRISHLLDEYRDVFEAPTGTVPDRPIRHGITLEAGVVPPRGCIYRMSEEELEVLLAQLDDLLDKGWTRPSCSPYGAPVLFVRKKNKDLRLCIDYRKLNAQTVKNAGPLPRIDDLLERLGGATYFSKLDLKSGYHQIEIQPQDRYKTAFKMRYGHFEWVVMPFGLTNAPATFQAAMTTEFRDLLDHNVLIYLDDILVYSRTLDEHIVHLRAVLDRLRLAKYKANLDKCKFAKQELEYLGHFVTPKGIRPLADKIRAIVDWSEPRCTTVVRSFMGLAGYYQQFVESYSKVAAPLSRLQSPKVPFEFDDAARGAFTTLKAAMQAAPALRIYDPTLPTQVTTDASGYGIGAVLEQCHEDGWHPVEYFSQKVPLVNTLDDARKKELLAFVTVLKRWRHFLLGRRRHRRPLLSRFCPEVSGLADQSPHKYAKGSYPHAAQANRRRLPCPFREEDLVWVLSEEFALEQDVSRKLLPKWFGPWEVTSAVGDDPAGPSFVVNIPPHLPVHRVFHASKLTIYTPPSAGEFPGRRSQDPPSMDGHQEVDRVITHRKYGNKPMQFEVTFKQCAPDDTRWISSADLQTSAPLIFADYEKRRLAKEAARPARPAPVSDRQLRPRR